MNQNNTLSTSKKIFNILHRLNGIAEQLRLVFVRQLSFRKAQAPCSALIRKLGVLQAFIANAFVALMQGERFILSYLLIKQVVQHPPK